MSVVAAILCCNEAQCSITEEERLRALRHVCSAMSRTAQALPEQVRQLSSAQADRRAAPHGLWLHRLLSAVRMA